MKKLVSIDEAAAMLAISRETVRRLIQRGAISPTRIGYRVLVPVSQLERLARTGWRYQPNYETRAGTAQAAGL